VYLNKAAQAAIGSPLFDADTKLTDKLFAKITHDQVSTAFRRVCRAVNISDFRFHELGHTAASWLRMRGTDIHTVAQLLGHKDLRMAARYQHLSPAFLGDAVGRLDAVFGELRYQDVTTQKQLEVTSAVSC
jgi:integrase